MRGFFRALGLNFCAFGFGGIKTELAAEGLAHLADVVGGGPGSLDLLSMLGRASGCRVGRCARERLGSGVRSLDSAIHADVF